MHSSSFSVAVIIVNWNGGKLLQRCLEHVLRQSLKPDKILLIDNGSTDNSGLKASEHPDVTVYFMNRNLGFAAANNWALHQCETEWVALLNPDALPKPDWLSNLMRAAQQIPQYSMFGSTQLMLNNPQQLDGLGDVYHCSGIAWREGHGQQRQEIDTRLRDIFSPCACAALYRRDALIELGGFDEDFFCYIEDVDLGFRLRLQGYRAYHVPEAIVYHAGSSSTGGPHSDFAVYHGHRNLVWTFVKNMPNPLFWLLLPLHLAMNAVTLLHFAVRGQSHVIFAAKRDALFGIAKIWRKRRAIQSRRKIVSMQIWRALDKRWIIK